MKVCGAKRVGGLLGCCGGVADAEGVRSGKINLGESVVR